MTSEESKTPGFLKFIPVIEKIFLAALVIAIILAVLNIDFLVLRISLTGVAATFFLMAYRPPEITMARDENEQGGFSELLALAIIPKVLWISSAISVLGVALYFFALGNSGYKQALIIGILSIAICLILLMIFLISGVKHLKTIVPVLFRAIPVSLAAIYFFLK